MSSMTAVCLVGTAGGIFLLSSIVLKPAKGRSAGYTLPKGNHLDV